MYFLIDFENVRNSGMQGTEHLLPDDFVMVFYSVYAPKMEQRHLTNISNSGCGFETYKLKAKRKNGLDFYIATKVGELFGAGRCKRAVLISNDDGFQAIRDFWNECSGTKNRIVLNSNIEAGIISSGENSARTNLIRSYQKSVDIGNYYAAFQENQRLRQAIRDAFAGTEFEDRLVEIEALLKNETAPRMIYIDSLRRFGRAGGQKVYRILKNSETFVKKTV